MYVVNIPGQRALGLPSCGYLVGPFRYRKNAVRYRNRLKERGIIGASVSPMVSVRGEDNPYREHTKER